MKSSTSIKRLPRFSLSEMKSFDLAPLQSDDINNIKDLPLAALPSLRGNIPSPSTSGFGPSGCGISGFIGGREGGSIKSLNWNDVKKHITFKRYHKFIQTGVIQNACDNYYRKLIKQYGITNISGGILTELFGNNFDFLPEYYLIKNEFPFNINNNIDQYILFINDKIPNNNNMTQNDLIQKSLSETFQIDIKNCEYLSSSFTNDFIMTYYPFYEEFTSNILFLFVRNNIPQINECEQYSDDKDDQKIFNKLHKPKPKIVLPQIKECIIWSELEEIISEEWIHKLYRDNEQKILWKKHIESVTNYSNYILSSQTFINNASISLCKHPFNFFGGIKHFIVYVRQDWKNTKTDGEIKDLLYNEYLIKNNLFNNINKDKWLYFEERSISSVLKINNDLNTLHLSSILDVDIFPNIFHIFIRDNHAYYHDITGPGTNTAPHALLYDEIVNYSLTGQVDKLGRNEKWMRKYKNDRKKGKKKQKKVSKITSIHIIINKPSFKGIKDKILINEFGLESLLNPNTNKLEAVIDSDTPSMFWADNFYPYSFYNGIKHNLVWYLCDKDEANNTVEKFIEANLPSGSKYAYWENPPHLKSIPDFNHFQVLSINYDEYWGGCGTFKLCKDINNVKCYKFNDFFNNNNDAKYGRKERICRKYYNQINENKKIYNTQKDLILRQVFKYDIKLDNNTNKLISIKSKNNINNNNYKLIQNKYPYHLENNLTQYVLFCTDINGLNDDKINEIINNNVDNSDKYVYWIPNKNNKTIKDLWCCHIIVKN